ncbi:MAG: hypothetical protein LWW81_06535 [Rhodocyclales bacterium]|nr:hypothetical protein [Rhodocyclales bacterium]
MSRQAQLTGVGWHGPIVSCRMRDSMRPCQPLGKDDEGNKQDMTELLQKNTEFRAKTKVAEY